MPTPKKNTTTKVDQNALPVSLKPSNANEFPMVYADNIWHIAASGSAMADEMGNTGQFDQQTVNEQLATLIASALADIVLFKKTDGTAGSIKKIVDDAIAAVIAEAPAAFDTLKEISDWIASHAQDASAMNTAIQGKVDKVEGKGLSENDYTDAEKSKLAGIESGAEANVIDGVTINGTAATIANKKVALSVPMQYAYICKNYGGSTSVSITAATHGCGNMPVVACYMGGKVVNFDITINAQGDVTVAWNTSTSVSASTPLTICIVGVNVTPVEEEQPIVVPDASDFPYLEFTKTDEGECSVAAANDFSETSVDIPAAIVLNGETLQVTSIEDEAFNMAVGLTTVTIPSSVSSIGVWAFDGCDSLTTINVSPNNQNYSSDSGVLFNKDKTSLIICPMRKSGEYVIPNSVTAIGEGSFAANYDLTAIIIPNSVTSIGENAFSGCESLNSITIPSSVETVGDSAFSGCRDLETVIIESGVETIGDYAFQYCPLTSVVIPDSVTSIGYGAFSDLDSNAVINCEAASKPVGWDNDWTDCTNVVWGYTPVVVPDASDFPKLSFVKTGNGECGVQKSNMEQWGWYHDDYQMSVVVPPAVVLNGETLQVTSIINNGLDADCLVSLSLPDTITVLNDREFANSNHLTYLDMPGVVTIGEDAIVSNDMMSLYIPESVTTIGALGVSINYNGTIYCEADEMPSGWSNHEWDDEIMFDWCNVPKENVLWGQTMPNN